MADRFSHQAWRPVTVGRAFRPLRGAAPGRVLEGTGGANLQLSSTSKILGIIAAAVLAGGLAACGMPSRAPTRSQQAPPARLTSQWGCSQTPPGGPGWFSAPTTSTWAWAERPLPGTWPGGLGWPPGMGGRQAGHLLAAARPGLRLHPTTYTVTVRLQDIVTHNGQPSYRTMMDFYVNRQGPPRCCTSSSTFCPADQSRGGTLKIRNDGDYVHRPPPQTRSGSKNVFAWPCRS